MGIKGLLPLLVSITKEVNIADYCGKTLGVDAYVWLHQKARCCATKLCLKQATKEYVLWFMEEVKRLKYNGVTPLIVFDGDSVSSKAKTEHKRRERRERAFKKGMAFYDEGRRNEAHKEFEKAIDVTPVHSSYIRFSDFSDFCIFIFFCI